MGGKHTQHTSDKSLTLVLYTRKYIYTEQ